MSKAVVLLSGGIDSFVAAHIASTQHDELLGLFISYGQPTASAEYDYASRQAANLRFHSFRCIKVPLIPFDINKIKKGAMLIPYRNTVLLSLAANLAACHDAQDVYIGNHSQDHAGYPDCRATFIRAVQELFVLQEAPMTIHAPLQNKTKLEIIQLGHELNLPLHNTWSCYQSNAKPCGTCASCTLRADAFKELGLEDPICS